MSLNNNHIELKQIRIANRIVEMTEGIGRSKITIALGGQPGAVMDGITQALSNEFELKRLSVKIINMEDFFKIPLDRRTDHRQRFGISSVGIDEVNWKSVLHLVNLFYNRKPVEIDKFGMEELLQEQSFGSLREADILLIKGFYACYYPADISFFIDLRYHEIRNSQLRSLVEDPSNFSIKVEDRERKELLKTRCRANFLVTPTLKVVNNLLN